MKNQRALSWLIAVLMTAVLFAFVLTQLDVRFAVNDDAATLHFFQGYQTGTPANFHIYITGLLSWPLHWLGLLAPTVAWYTWMQLAFLFLACVVIEKSVMQCFARRGQPLWLGAVVSACFAVCLVLKSVARITFTQTAAVLGAAAVLQIFSIEHDRPRRVIVGMLGALGLVVLAYSLRQLTALPILAFCGLAFVCVFWEEYGLGRKARRCAKPMLLSLLIVAVVMGALAGLREMEITLGGHREQIEWQQARIGLIDYYHIAGLSDEAVSAAGWSPATHRLINEWSFLDSSVTTESFRAALEVAQREDPRTLADAWPTFTAAVEGAGNDVWGLALTAAALVCCVLGAVLTKGKRGYLAAVGCAVLGALAMIAYLAVAGRLPARAILMVLLPASAVLFALLPACFAGNARALLAVCAAVCVAVSGWYAAGVVPGLYPDEEDELALGSAMGDLEEYALSEPESLFIYDSTLAGADQRAFPDYSEGMPHNITFWGGWGYRSPENIQLFENFGIDIDNFDPETFLRDDVYLVSGRVDPPPQRLMEWITEKTGKEIDWEIYSEYGSVYILHFYEY